MKIQRHLIAVVVAGLAAGAMGFAAVVGTLFDISDALSLFLIVIGMGVHGGLGALAGGLASKKGISAVPKCFVGELMVAEWATTAAGVLLAVGRLDLGFLVNADDRGLGRVEIQVDEVFDLVDKQRVGRQLEALRAVGLLTGRAPDLADRCLGHPCGRSHRTRRPMSGIGRLGFQGLDYHGLDPVIDDSAWRRGPVLINQALRRRSTNRFRHFVTVLAVTPTSAATAWLVAQVAQASTIRARTAIA
ncbi:MAG TPA: hypothetical protein VHT30_09435 [Acidimicrobiales bacterium]|nr:hypothetical protein [Acidimicrobiales bacterium]